MSDALDLSRLSFSAFARDMDDLIADADGAGKEAASCSLDELRAAARHARLLDKFMALEGRVQQLTSGSNPNVDSWEADVYTFLEDELMPVLRLLREEGK